MARKVLIVCAEAANLAAKDIPIGLRKVKETGTCEFCPATVLYNRDNYNEQRGKGLVPVLICGSCYTYGNHHKQGYRA